MTAEKTSESSSQSSSPLDQILTYVKSLETLYGAANLAANDSREGPYRQIRYKAQAEAYKYALALAEDIFNQNGEKGEEEQQ